MYKSPVNFNLKHQQTNLDPLAVSLVFPVFIKAGTPPSHILSVGGSWSVGLNLEADNGGGWSRTGVQEQDHVGAWGTATIRENDYTSSAGTPRVVDDLAGGAWGTAGVRDGDLRASHSIARPNDQGKQVQAWAETSLYLDNRYEAAHEIGKPQDTDRMSWFQSVLSVNRRPVYPTDLVPPLHAPDALALEFDFGVNYEVIDPRAANIVLAPPLPVVPPTAVDSHAKVGRTRVAPVKDDSWRLPWAATGGQHSREYGVKYPQEPMGQPIEPGLPVDQKDTYRIMNSIIVTSHPAGVPLDVRNISIALDVDSYCWTFSGTLVGKASLAFVKPDLTGQKEISVTLNGYQWIFMVEKHSVRGDLANEVYTVSGSSRIRYMGAPFAPLRSKMVNDTTDAKQLMEAELLNTGFTVDWNVIEVPSWAVQAGSWGYTGKRPIEVIRELADAIGFFIRPGMATDEVQMKLRYPFDYWQPGEPNIQHNVSISQVKTTGGDYQPGQEYDSAFVSGTTHGVSIKATKMGHGGTATAPDHYNPLVQDTQQARTLARKLINEGGDKQIETFTTLLWPDSMAPGLLLPGNTVKMNHPDSPDDDWYGIVIQVAVSANGISGIHQQVSVERHIVKE